MRTCSHPAIRAAHSSRSLMAALALLMAWAHAPAVASLSGQDLFEIPSPASPGNPHRIVSPPVPAHPAAKADPTAATFAAMDAHPLLAGVSSGDMEVRAVKRAPGITYVHLRRLLRGFPILNTHAVFQWDNSGRLRAAGIDTRPELDTSSITPAWDGSWISEEAARSAALAGLPDWLEGLECDPGEQGWLPVDAGAATELVPVWNIRLRTMHPPGWWDAMVDGGTGIVLSRENLASVAGWWGTMLAEVEPSYPGDSRRQVPLQGVRVEAGDESAAVSWTDAQGRFGFDLPSDREWPVHARLLGHHARIEDASDNNRVPGLRELVSASDEPVILWDDTNSTIQQRSAYVHVQDAHSFIRALDNGAELDALDSPMPVRIDVPTAEPYYYCNAWWDGYALSFYAARERCPSYARIADIVYHEYGHAVTHHIYKPMLAPSSMNEAWSDYMAATMKNDSVIGRGGYGPGTFMRDIDVHRVWPDDASPIPHIEGLILAGALWDLRRLLGPERADSLFHFARYGAAQNFDDYMLDMLVFDDDDGDLSNGTPNWEAIIGAFSSRGIGNYEVRMEAAALGDQYDPGSYIETEARIWALIGLRAGSIALRVRFGDDGGFMALPADQSEGGNTYRARIPAPPPGTAVSYYWYAESSDGRTGTLPAGAPDELYTFSVLADTEAPALEVLPLYAMAADAGVMCLQAEASDNSGRIAFVRAEVLFPRVAEPVLFDLQQAAPGVYRGCIWMAGQSSPAVGDTIWYRMIAEDQAAAPNRAVWPEDGHSVIRVYQGRTIDFENDDGGMIATGDWQWGSPPEDQNLTFSGNNVWATVLDGNYSGSTFSTLTWGPLDLSSLETARLEFRHRYMFETFYDGGNVKIRTGSDPVWTLLEPEGGYPETFLALNQRGYSGYSRGWERAVFALDRHLSEEVWLEFQTGTDGYVDDPGWYLDDVTIIGMQLHASPVAFRASGTESSRVSLTWRQPPGIDVEAPGFMGYTLYRSEGPLPFDARPLFPVPVKTTRFVDRTVAGGTAYTYRLHAVYSDGVSPEVPASVVTAAPGRADLNVRHVEVTVSGYSPVDTSLVVGNQGNGVLTFNTFVAEQGRRPDDVRIVYDLEPSFAGGDAILWEAPEGPDGTLGIRSLELRQWIDGTWGEMLEVRISGRRPWGDPMSDWGGFLFIDTDDNLNTSHGDRRFGLGEIRNIGYEYAVAFGRFTPDVDFYGGEGAVIVDAQQARLRLPLPYVEMPEDADSIAFFIPLSAIGYSRRLQVALFAGASRGGTPWDQIPSLPEGAGWLDRHPRSGAVPRGQARPLQIALDPAGLVNGVYQGRIILESNDPMDPQIPIDVVMRVERGFPEELAFREFAYDLEGVRLTIDLRPESGPVMMRAERTLRGRGEWKTIADSLGHEPGRPLTLIDSGVVQEQRYEYRFAVTRADGAAHMYGPFSAVYRPQVPGLSVREAVPTDHSVELRAVLPGLSTPVSSVSWERRVSGDSLWVRIPSALTRFDGPAGVAEASDRWIPLLWSGAEPGIAYVYRMLVTLGSGATLVIDGFEAVFDPDMPVEVALHPGRPNPFRSEILLQLDLPEAGRVGLTVFDVNGRRVRRLDDQELEAGVHRYVWNGTDDTGRAVPSGVYWALATTPSGTRSVRLLRLMHVR